MFNKDFKCIFYIFITILVSVGQSIILINRVFGNNHFISFFLHLLAWLPPMFLFEQLINVNSKKRFLVIMFSFYCFFIFITFPDFLIADLSLRAAVKLLGGFLPAVIISYIYNKERLSVNS